ncbi:hypothetical protein GCM10022224_052350 [Nonomuraea antimicrobica]|uniref:Acetyltransferase (GNAT) domain-containing protein n=1 Tax=Nonomuraea antimicrobica TaxID=561173 RepID=A0ABP7C722_9ACTN
MTLGPWWASCGYAWRTGSGPLVNRLHRLVDAAGSVRPLLTRSRDARGGLPLAYAGHGDGLRYLLPFLEERREGATVARHRGRVTWRDLASGRAAPDAGLIAVGCSAGRAAALPAAGSLVLPFRLSLVVPVDEGVEAVRRRVSRKDRQQYARERERRAWTVEQGTADADFAFFYRRMHRPTMRRRHGESARSESPAVAYHCLFRHGALLFLREGGERVAGMLCRYEPAARTLVIRLAGVLDGAESHYRSSAYLGMYVGVLEWAARQGLRAVNLSGCEPFLSKGIFQYKRKLHPEVSLPGDHFGGKRVWLRIQRDSGPLRDFLVANPAVTIDAAGRLHATYFHDAARPARTDLQWRTPGIADRRLIDLDDFMAAAPTTPHAMA